MEIKTALFLVLYMITSVYYLNILNRLILFYHIIGIIGKKVQKISKYADTFESIKTLHTVLIL